jgi:hypothetical protein
LWQWLKTTQGLLTAVAPVLAIMGGWWQLGLPRVVFSDEPAPAFSTTPPAASGTGAPVVRAALPPACSPARLMSIASQDAPERDRSPGVQI